MHQDQRIGLAFGVLLIGACAAFFFRNEAQDRPETPRLQNAQKLDDQIAERATRPYLKGIEAVEAADKARTRVVADHTSSLNDADDDHSGYWSPQSGRRKPSATLTDVESDVQELAPIPVPTDGADGAPFANDTTLKGSPHHAGPKPVDGRTGGATHVVQKGETLSSIAAKRLGSPNRFQDLFEANTDQLRDANDLRSGMVLKLPGSRSSVASKGSTSRNHPSVTREVPSPYDENPTIHGSSETVGTSIERRHAAPKIEVDEAPASRVTSDESGEKVGDTHSPSRKFVPSKKVTPNGRPAGT
jgi:LysM repeat protein